MGEAVLKKRKRSWWRLLLELLVILSIVLAVRFWFQRDLPSGPAPAFQSVLMDGKVVNLKDYRGEPLLLYFWASWCQFCKVSEAPLTGLQEDWNVLSVAFQSGDKQAVGEYIKEHGLESWDVIPDQDGRLAELFGVQAVPTSYIIDGKGNIRLKEVGLTTGWGLRARLWYVKNVNSLAGLFGLDKKQSDGS
ncbi:MAG: protein disulfide oxidoreductase [Proteobacteria bacterium]|nr:MAG: protein disulfide oxidoreductase [Pseudomonadota bacterium]